MENNHHHHHFSNMCEKIFGVIYPTFHKNHHQDYSGPAAIPNHHPHHDGYGSNSYVTQTKPSSNGIPPTSAKATSQAVHARHMPNYLVAQKENSGGVDDINNAFSDYINHAKIKIRAVSNIGDGEEIVSRVDNVIDREKEDDDEDEFSSYINRAKLRMRKTSSIGSRNMISFKRE